MVLDCGHQKQERAGQVEPRVFLQSSSAVEEAAVVMVPYLPGPICAHSVSGCAAAVPCH